MRSWYRPAVEESSRLAKILAKVVLLFYIPTALLLTLIQFPRDADLSSRATSDSGNSTLRTSANFYESAYQAGSTKKRGLDYEEVARAAADSMGIDPAIRKFVRDHGLERKRILEVGSGRGYLQDVVDDYTGLDLSSQVARFYHKNFVAASATEMPFPDSSFDAIWTVWVLEHIPEPERTLMEIRRVLKPGGLLYLAPAWNCTSWAADGLEVRPYSDFNMRGKLLKASLPFQRFPVIQMMHVFPVRGIRWAQYKWGGNTTRLRFHALDPNYDTYWQPDSDAAVSLDRFETFLWFQSRGDECLNCIDTSQVFTEFERPLVIRIAKKPSDRA
jgi:SAM-dependent methyltransferase